MTGNQTELQIIEHMHRRAVAQGIPLSGTFELTPLCSMACKMCYVRISPEELAATGKRLRTADEWLALAREAKEQGMLLLLLTGGEPFLYPEFRRLYTELRQMGFVISINSNATLITEETVAWLKENPPQRINITLYGASDATYARLCGHPTGFTQVTRAIELLRDAGISVKLNCSVTPENVCDLEDIIAYSDEHKLVLQATSYMFPPLRRDAESVGRNARFAAEECARTEVKIRRGESARILQGHRVAPAGGHAAVRRLRGRGPAVPRREERVLGHVGRAHDAVRHGERTGRAPVRAGLCGRMAVPARADRRAAPPAGVRKLRREALLPHLRRHVLHGNRALRLQAAVPVRSDARRAGGLPRTAFRGGTS